MRKIIILIFLFISANSLAQEGFFKVPARFYSIIDSTHKLQCCDSSYHGYGLSYEIPLYELPYDKLDIDDYVFNVTQDGYLDSYVQDLVDAYYKMKPSIRKQMTKSCFKLKTDYKVNHDITADGNYWIEGTLKITIHFQSDDKYFGYPWWKKIFKIKPKA
jgi:hypothetical protein